jgi:capsular polysaccharide biosynthesis protein
VVSETVRPPVARESRRSAPSRWRSPALLAFVLFAVLGVLALGAVQRLPTTYAARAVVTVLPRPDAQVGADTVQLVGQKYAVLATSSDVLAAAAAATGEQADLTTATSAALAAGTGNLDVTVTLADPERAARVANTIAGLLIRDARQDELVTAELTARATAGDAETKPPRMLLRGAALVAAALAAAAVWALLAGRAARRREFGA